MTVEQQTALNMARFIRSQSDLLCLKLLALDLGDEAFMCKRLHNDIEWLCNQLPGLFEFESV